MWLNWTLYIFFHSIAVGLGTVLFAAEAYATEEVILQHSGPQVL